VVPLAAALISAAFALTLGAQYAARRRPYLLAWCVALSIYALAAATEVLGAAAGWNPALFRAYYYLGGIVLVGVLALGTVYLLAPRLAPFALFTLTGLSLLGLVAVLGADVRAEPLLTHQVPPLRAIPPEGGLFNALAVALAVLINVVGSMILIGGALWSAYGLWRRGHPWERLVANVLIALGAFIVAGASSLTRFGSYDLFYVGQAAGVAVMFLGFLSAQQVLLPSRASRSTA
jgi:hypothetical protein